MALPELAHPSHHFLSSTHHDRRPPFQLRFARYGIRDVCGVCVASPWCVRQPARRLHHIFVISPPAQSATAGQRHGMDGWLQADTWEKNRTSPPRFFLISRRQFGQNHSPSARGIPDDSGPLPGQKTQPTNHHGEIVHVLAPNLAFPSPLLLPPAAKKGSIDRVVRPATSRRFRRRWAGAGAGAWAGNRAVTKPGGELAPEEEPPSSFFFSCSPFWSPR